MHKSVMDFIYTTPQHWIEGRRVLEMGSLYVNGSARPHITSLGAHEYIGIDIVQGKGVDLILNGYDTVKHFGKESFDVVISTETLEHVKDWKRFVSNMKNVLRPGGYLIFSVRGPGMHYHPFPDDYWRFTFHDILYIFKDMDILLLERDPEVAGVLLMARKPDNFIEKNLDGYPIQHVEKRSRGG